jgi:hypothetical protein
MSDGIPLESSSLNSPLRVKDSLALQNLGKDGDGRVDRVGDDQDEGLGTSLSDGFGKSSTDSGVDLRACDLRYKRCVEAVILLLEDGTHVLQSERRGESDRVRYTLFSQRRLSSNIARNLRKGHLG